MEKIPPTMIIHKHVSGADTIFFTMPGPLVNNPLGKWLGVIRRGSYQAAAEDSRWVYETVSDFWPNIYPDRNYSVDDSSDEVRKNKITLIISNKRWYELRVGTQGGSDGVTKYN